MDKAILRWSRVCLIGGLLLLGACSSTNFVYNRLDFLIPWYVDDYADLDVQQKTYLEKEMVPFLAWHRSQELPDYLKILEGIEDNLDRPQTPEMFFAVFGDFETAWLRLESKGLDWMLGLGAQGAEQQVPSDKAEEKKAKKKAQQLPQAPAEQPSPPAVAKHSAMPRWWRVWYS